MEKGCHHGEPFFHQGQHKKNNIHFPGYKTQREKRKELEELNKKIEKARERKKAIIPVNPLFQSRQNDPNDWGWESKKDLHGLYDAKFAKKAVPSHVRKEVRANTAPAVLNSSGTPWIGPESPWNRPKTPWGELGYPRDHQIELSFYPRD